MDSPLLVLKVCSTWRPGTGSAALAEAHIIAKHQHTIRIRFVFMFFLGGFSSRTTKSKLDKSIRNVGNLAHPAVAQASSPASFDSVSLLNPQTFLARCLTWNHRNNYRATNGLNLIPPHRVVDTVHVMIKRTISNLLPQEPRFLLHSSRFVRHAACRKPDAVRLIVLLSLLHFLPAVADGAESPLSLRLPSSKPEVFERVQITVSGMPAAANPFDPESITLDAEITHPSGKKLRVPGFFSREFQRKLEKDREILTPQSEGEWVLRWLPLEAGRHQLSCTTSVRGTPVAKGEAVIEVTAGNRPGLVRVEPRQKRYFCLDDGSPLFLNGLCVCWHGNRGTYDYDDWLAACQKARHQLYPDLDVAPRLRHRVGPAGQAPLPPG
jgi:hypothetical protein